MWRGHRAVVVAVLAVAISCGVGIASTTHAHRGHGVWSDVVWTGDRFEITHRMHLADAIRVLESLDSRHGVESIQGQALLALYVEQGFGIVGADSAPVMLGAETHDDFLYVYQEWLTPLPDLPPGFESTLLLELEPDAENWVHYRTPDADLTLRLDAPRQPVPASAPH